MTTNESLIFAVMVFIAVILLSIAVIVPTAGSAAQANRRMQKRIAKHLEARDPAFSSLIRDEYLKKLSPFEKRIEKIAFLAPLSRLIEQSGASTSVAGTLFLSFLLGSFGAIVALLFLHNPLIALLAGLVLSTAPIVLIVRKRSLRMNTFEEQLPAALDIMGRALKAGLPFNDTLKLVAEEMQDPIAKEFGRVSADLNFGLPLNVSLSALLSRIPSMSLHTLITAVLVQNETGGALAEILDNVAAVIRSRFKFQRKVKTLSAEGRMSAWVLVMIPFTLGLVLSLSSPDYLTPLLTEPLGKKMILYGFGAMIVGIFWVRSIIRIEV